MAIPVWMFGSDFSQFWRLKQSLRRDVEHVLLNKDHMIDAWWFYYKSLGIREEKRKVTLSCDVASALLSLVGNASWADGGMSIGVGVRDRLTYHTFEETTGFSDCIIFLKNSRLRWQTVILGMLCRQGQFIPQGMYYWRALLGDKRGFYTA